MFLPFSLMNDVEAFIGKPSETERTPLQPTAFACDRSCLDDKGTQNELHDCWGGGGLLSIVLTTFMDGWPELVPGASDQ